MKLSDSFNPHANYIRQDPIDISDKQAPNSIYWRDIANCTYGLNFTVKYSNLEPSSLQHLSIFNYMPDNNTLWKLARGSITPVAWGTNVIIKKEWLEALLLSTKPVLILLTASFSLKHVLLKASKNSLRITGCCNMILRKGEKKHHCTAIISLPCTRMNWMAQQWNQLEYHY